ncbi:MAG TPA: HAD family hydrolase [Vicinamibacterales bacterium]|nr:HAD family hydrolase [Vicinamibacterales bacterium]
MPRPPTRAVFFDVDFTLIYPGPMFQGAGYREFCARRGIDVDPARFDAAVAAASGLLDADAGGGTYDPAVFVRYTRRIIEGMGGRGAQIDAAAADIYGEWAACRHFSLYEDVPDVLRALHARGFRIGLISNTQRSLASFEEHFGLSGLFAVALSSSDHGYMKPHPSIFEEALRRAGALPAEAVMVGDSVPHDIEGARRLGMRGVLVARSGVSRACPPDIPVIRSLRELPPLL